MFLGSHSVPSPFSLVRENNRQKDIADLTSRGIVPFENEVANAGDNATKLSVQGRPWLMGSVSALIKDVLPAQEIVDNMVKEAVECLGRAQGFVVKDAKAKL